MPQVDIIVGSQMGSAEYVAEQLQEALEDQGFETVLHEQPNFDDCQQANWLVVTSTYGAGDYPDNLLSFIEQVTAQSALSQLKHAVVGIGDSSYDTYNYAAKNCDALLKSKGSQSLLAPLEINVLEEALPEDTALAWLPNLINKLADN